MQARFCPHKAFPPERNILEVLYPVACPCTFKGNSVFRKSEVIMLYKRILLPVDGSPHATRAIEQAIHLARDGGTIIVTTIVPVIPEAITGEAFLKAKDDVERGGHLITETALKTIASAGIPYEERIIFADSPASGIVYAATDLHCHIIVMAPRGRSEIEGILLGSVTHRVLALSPLPVLVVR